MRLLELLFPSAKSRASIAKTEDASQISLKRIKEPLTSTFFLPNMSEKQTIKLWASYIAFYSLVSIVTLLTFTHDISLIIRHSIETVVITSLVVTGEMVFWRILPKNSENLIGAQNKSPPICYRPRLLSCRY